MIFNPPPDAAIEKMELWDSRGALIARNTFAPIRVDNKTCVQLTWNLDFTHNTDTIGSEIKLSLTPLTKSFLARAFTMLDIIEGHKVWTDDEKEIAKLVGWVPRNS